MQKLRAIAVAVTAMIVVSASANAQSVSNFDNSWFWGFKSGVNSFAVPGHGNTSTVDLGLDWVITRSKGGLYVSGNQSVFQRDLEFGDPTSQTGQRTVRVNDMRRITLASVRGQRQYLPDQLFPGRSRERTEPQHSGRNGRRPDSDEARGCLHSEHLGPEQQHVPVQERSQFPRVRNPHQLRQLHRPGLAAFGAPGDWTNGPVTGAVLFLRL